VCGGRDELMIHIVNWVDHGAHDVTMMLMLIMNMMMRFTM
jgi:hypothetical protein